MVKHFKSLTAEICLSIRKKALVNIFVLSDIPFPKGQLSISLFARYGDHVEGISPGNAEEGKGVSHLGKKKGLLERGIRKDMNKISCNDQPVLCSFLLGDFTSLLGNGQMICTDPTTDHLSLDISPLVVLTEMVDSDRRSGRDGRML